MVVGHQQLTVGTFYCFEKTVAIAKAAITGANNGRPIRQKFSIENKMLHPANMLLRRKATKKNPAGPKRDGIVSSLQF